MQRRSFVILAALVLVCSAAAQVRAADATGTWTWETPGRNGNTNKQTLKLKQEGDKLTGTVQGARGSAMEIKNGKIDGNEISFKVTRERNGTTATTTYTGKLEGDTIKGKIESEGRNGQTRSRDWEAKRQKGESTT